MTFDILKIRLFVHQITMSGYDFRDACEAGDLDKVKGLSILLIIELKHLFQGLIKSIDVNETDEFGYTGLHLAAEHGHLKVVEELMVRKYCGEKIWRQNIISSLLRLVAPSLTLLCLTATISQSISQSTK